MFLPTYLTTTRNRDPALNNVAIKRGTLIWTTYALLVRLIMQRCKQTSPQLCRAIAFNSDFMSCYSSSDHGVLNAF
jgi:hypothetical protein